MAPDRVWLVAALVLGQAPVEGRSAMSVPAVRVFEGMLRFARSGEGKKLLRSVELLRPVLAEHEGRFGAEAVADLRARLRSAGASAATAAVEELVLRDVVVLLGGIPESSEDRARSLIRAAMLEWRLVEERVGAQDLRVAQSVGARLRDLRLLVDDGAGGVPELVETLEEELLDLAGTGPPPG